MTTVSQTPPPGSNSDWTIPQDWEAYTAEEHATWDRLFARQAKILDGRVTDAFLKGLDVLRLSKPGIPDTRELSERLLKLTGWEVVAVPGLIPDEMFFAHLACRRFVAGRFIRRPDQMDYLEEPDVFHDVFGHVPLLANPAFADYMQAYGVGGLRAVKFRSLEKLARLYWYTVEFGLIREQGALKLYGSGIVSSFAESIFALEDPSPNRLGFDLERVMRTHYRIDDYQQTYFVIDSFEDLLRQTAEIDFEPLYARLASRPDLATDTVLPSDSVITLGSHAHALRKDRV